MLTVGTRVIDRNTRREAQITDWTQMRNGGETRYKVNGKWLTETEIGMQYEIMGEDELPDDTAW